VAVFYIRATLHGSATVYGLIEAAWTAGMLVGGWVGSWRPGGDRSLSRRLVVLHLATAAVCIVAGRLTGVGWMFPLWFLGGICNGMVNNALAVLVARRVPGASRGRCYAVLAAIASGANLIGFTLGGVLVEQVSPATIISGGGVLGFVLVALLGIHIWRVSASEPAVAKTSPAPGRPDASTGQCDVVDPGDRASGPVEAVASRS
jgi:MFS family permease